MAESMRMRLDFKPSLKRTEVSPAVTLALPTFEEVYSDLHCLSTEWVYHLM